MTGAMKQCQLLLAIRMTSNHVFKLFASFDGIGKDKSYSTPARCVRQLCVLLSGNAQYNSLMGSPHLR